MKFVLAAAIVAFTSVALPVAAKPCDENASEAMKRPGGYCETIMEMSSLSTPSDDTAALPNQGNNAGEKWTLPKGAKVPKM